MIGELAICISLQAKAKAVMSVCFSGGAHRDSSTTNGGITKPCIASFTVKLSARC